MFQQGIWLAMSIRRCAGVLAGWQQACQPTWAGAVVYAAPYGMQPLYRLAAEL